MLQSSIFKFKNGSLNSFKQDTLIHPKNSHDFFLLDFNLGTKPMKNLFLDVHMVFLLRSFAHMHEDRGCFFKV